MMSAVNYLHYSPLSAKANNANKMPKFIVRRYIGARYLFRTKRKMERSDTLTLGTLAHFRHFRHF